MRTTEGVTLGFVFCEATSSVHELREAIDLQVLQRFGYHNYRIIKLLIRNKIL